MKKILLIIIQIIIIKCECPKGCLECKNAHDSTKDNIQCIKCANGYYLKNDTKNCYPKNEIRNYHNFPQDVRKLEFVCDQACTSCYGEKEGVDTKCYSCNEDEGFFPIIGNENLCMNKIIDSEFLENYYFDSIHNGWNNCYRRCLTCKYGGSDEKNNCTVCRPNYYFYKSNCLEHCSGDLFAFNFECVDDCTTKGLVSDLLSKTCLSECPSGTVLNQELGICSIQSIEEFENMDCDDIIENNIKDKMKYYINDNSFIKGKNCFIQVYNAKDQNRVHENAEKKYLSKLFLNSEYLNSNTIVIKIDYNRTYEKKPEVNDINFILYKKISNDEYEEISELDLIKPKNSDDLIYIEKPFIYLENIQVYKLKYEAFDIFNARNEIYNNFCKEFTTEYGTDLTYDYRRDNYFVNISELCFNDSTIYYSGFNSKTTSIQCKANYLINIFTGEEKVGNSRFKIFRCSKYLSDNLGINLGFWIIFLIVLFNIGVGYFFWRAPFLNIMNFLRVFEREFNKPTGLVLKWTVLNPPKKSMKLIYEPKEFILDKELNDQENEIKFGRYLNKYHKQRKEKLDKIQNNNHETEKNLKLEGDIEKTSSSMGYTLTYKDISFSKSSGSSKSSTYMRKLRKMEEEKRIREKKKKEYLNFMEDAHQKDKALFAQKVYNKSLDMPKPEMDKVMKDYNKQQDKINEEKIIKTNLLRLDKVGNVVRDPEVNFKPFNMKYEPKEYLDKYMFHNYIHLLPVPKSERISSGSLSSDIRNELQKLQQLREKKMVETIFLKKIVYTQKLIKGYNEDFFPFSFDECIIRRKDEVTYLMIFWNYLKEVSLIANVIFDYNFLENRFLKIILLGFEFLSFIFFNLLFYSDDYINDFYTHKGKYHFIYQITKSIYASLCTVVVVKLMSLLITCKDRFRKIILTRNYENDNDYRKNYKFWIIILAIKYGVFYLIIITMIIIGWIYYMCFSVPYRHSPAFVLVGTIFSILIYEMLGIGTIALVSRLKYVSIKAQHRRLYNIMMIVNKFL